MTSERAMQVTPERGWVFATRSLYGDILLSTGGRLVAAALTFAKTVLLVRLLEPSVYGVVAVVLSWGYIASGVGELGCGAAFILLESSSVQAQQMAHFWSFLRSRVLVSAVLGALWGAAATTGLVTVAGISGPALLFGLGQNICHAPEFLFQAERRFTHYSRFLVGVGVLQLLWSIAALALYRQWQLGQQALWILLALAPWFAAVATLLPLAMSQWRLVKPSFKADWAYLRTMVAFGKWVAAGGLLAYVFQRWAVITLGRTGNPHAAGAYDVAVTCAQAVNLLTLAVVSALSPRFAGSHDQALARRGLVRLLKRGGPIVAAVLALYYLLRGQLITALFGPEYGASTAALDALMPSFLLSLLTQPMVAYATFGLRAPQVVCWAAMGCTALLMLAAGAITRSFGVTGLALLQSVLLIVEHLVITLYALYGPRAGA